MKTVLQRRWAVSIYALIGLAFLFVTFWAVFIASASHATDNSGKLVTIYDRGQEKVILSSAKTIGDAINEAGIKIDDTDFVEPGVKEEMTASSYRVNIYRSRPVIIVDGSVRQKIVTPYQTPEQIAAAAGITLYPEDITTISKPTDITDGVGIQLNIKRAITFNFNLYGRTSLVRTQAKTVGDMLKEKNIELTTNDRISVDQSTPIVSGMNVKIWREGKQVVTIDEVINFDVEKIENADKPMGYVLVKMAGVSGQRSVTYEIEMQNGQEVSRKEIVSLMIKPAQKQVEEVGVMGQYNTPSENENITWQYLTSHGFSRIQTAGIMGNLRQEHGFRTDGDGLAQWTGSRRAQLYSRPYPTNIYTQLDFLYYELTTNYAKVGNAIKATNSLVTAVQIFQNQYERCGLCMESNRIQYAQNILASH